MLHYSLVHNPMVENENIYRAVPCKVHIYRTDDLLEMMAMPGGLTRGQVLAVLEALATQIEHIVAGGDAVQTELFSIYPVIKGRFGGVDDRFSRKRHKLSLDMRAGERIVKAQDKTRLKKSGVHKRRAEIESVTRCGDSNCQEGTLICKPGTLLLMQGSLLKIDLSDEKQGIYLVAKNETYRVTAVHSNNRSEVLFSLPQDLPDGTYGVELRLVLHGNRSLSRAVYTERLTISSN